MWSCAGIVLISEVAQIGFKQTLEAASLIGVTPIVAGIVVMDAFPEDTSP